MKFSEVAGVVQGKDDLILVVNPDAGTFKIIVFILAFVSHVGGVWLW